MFSLTLRQFVGLYGGGDIGVPDSRTAFIRKLVCLLFSVLGTGEKVVLGRSFWRALFCVFLLPPCVDMSHFQTEAL